MKKKRTQEELDALIDSRLIEHLDWTYQPPCDIHTSGVPCEVQAAVTAQCRRCGFSWMLCDGHLQWYKTL